MSVLRLFFAILLLSSPVISHQVVYEAKGSDAITVKIGYDDGTCMSYAEVKIYSPHDEKIEYQNGRTDKNGCFAFSPDDTGEWTVQVNDGAGHGAEIKIPVQKNMAVDFVHHGYSPRQRILMGICVIWAILATSLFLKYRKYKLER